MIDPMTALAGIQSAVALIKKVSKTVDDVTSLGPVLGKYFDAKSKASKAAVAAKRSGKTSNMSAAIQIELALEQTKQFERELQLLFMQAGKIDVWNKIKQRAYAMDVEEAREATRLRNEEIRRRQKFWELMEITLASITGAVIAGLMIYGGIFLIKYCMSHQCTFS